MKISIDERSREALRHGVEWRRRAKQEMAINNKIDVVTQGVKAVSDTQNGDVFSRLSRKVRNLFRERGPGVK